VEVAELEEGCWATPKDIHLDMAMAHREGDQEQMAALLERVLVRCQHFTPNFRWQLFITLL
jgi:hypothetical protein